MSQRSRKLLDNAVSNEDDIDDDGIGCVVRIPKGPRFPDFASYKRRNDRAKKLNKPQRGPQRGERVYELQ